MPFPRVTARPLQPPTRVSTHHTQAHIRPRLPLEHPPPPYPIPICTQCFLFHLQCFLLRPRTQCSMPTPCAQVLFLVPSWSSPALCVCSVVRQAISTTTRVCTVWGAMPLHPPRGLSPSTCTHHPSEGEPRSCVCVCVCACVRVCAC